MSQWSDSSISSPRVTHIWICDGVLALFMMGKFGLEKGSGQLFKWRFKLTLSCNKSHFLDACAAAAKLLVRGGSLPAEGDCARWAGSLGAAQSCLQSALPAQAAWGLVGAAQGSVPALSSQPWWPWHILIPASYHHKKKPAGIDLLPYLAEEGPHIHKLL